MRKADGFGIAVSCDPLDIGPAGVRQLEDRGDLVKRLAGSIVDRRAEQPQIELT